MQEEIHVQKIQKQRKKYVGVSTLLYKIKISKLIHGKPWGSEVFRPSCISLWKMLKIKKMNYFYIMAKMYSNEPKINHHSL